MKTQWHIFKHPLFPLPAQIKNSNLQQEQFALFSLMSLSLRGNKILPDILWPPLGLWSGVSVLLATLGLPCVWEAHISCIHYTLGLSTITLNGNGNCFRQELLTRTFWVLGGWVCVVNGQRNFCVSHFMSRKSFTLGFIFILYDNKVQEHIFLHMLPPPIDENGSITMIGLYFLFPTP